MLPATAQRFLAPLGMTAAPLVQSMQGGRFMEAASGSPVALQGATTSEVAAGMNVPPTLASHQSARFNFSRSAWRFLTAAVSSSPNLT